MEERMDLLTQIRRQRRSSYGRAVQEQKYEVARTLEDYEGGLPRFQGKPFIQHIEERLEASLEVSNGVSVLDVGCGAGIAVAKLKENFPKLKAYGISAYDYREQILDPKVRDFIKYQVDYRTGDIQRLLTVFPDEKFDFIISFFTFIHLGDRLNALRQCYRLLKTGGILFVDNPGIHLSIEDTELLQNYWKKRGIEVELAQYIAPSEKGIIGYDLAIKKGKSDKLPLPFRYQRLTPENPLGYAFDRQVAVL